MPKFSIIVPVYNVAPYLRECLDSLLSQSFVDWEALCVDDGSTDQSGIILDEYAERDKRIRVFHQPNAGVSAARNFAQEKAKGEWLMYLDSDDVYLPGALSFAATLTKLPFDAFIFQRPVDFTDGASCEMKGCGKMVDQTQNGENGFDFWNRHIEMPGFPFLRMLRSSKFRTCRYPANVRIMEDDVQLQLCLAIPSQWAFIDKSIYGYRRRHSSATGSVDLSRSVSAIGAMDLIFNQLELMRELPRNYPDRFWSRKSGIFTDYALKLLKENRKSASIFEVELDRFFKRHGVLPLPFLVMQRLRIAHYSTLLWFDRFLHHLWCLTLKCKNSFGFFR